MAVPTAYTEAELAAFMAGELGTGSGTVGGDLAPDLTKLQTSVWDVVARYGVAAIASATNIPRLQAMARARVWSWAVDQYVTRYKIGTDGQTLERQMLYTHAKERAEYWQGQAAIMASLTPGSTTSLRPAVFAVAPGYRGR